ncbi:MAG: S-adenosylmethionine:tRNA ribosyltransferase-isomerase, partial [Bacteroidetes bacterium]|nr:S-adenosylmethionine:tRNA ribosyltransferase-isomerase [Bacteroidota bacterium]
VRKGMNLSVNFENEIILKAAIINRRQNEAIVKFYWLPENLTFSDVLIKIGNVPLPPYINRNIKLEDKHWYQTVYAQSNGSVAAPTAGFHFTDEIIKQLNKKNIKTENIVLHVGPGTFKPIDVDDVNKHEMHSERISVTKHTLENIIQYLKNTENNSISNYSKSENNRIIATGTTTLRTLESLYWFGCKLILNKNINADDIQTLEQWESYEIANNIKLPTEIEALGAILLYISENNLKEFTAKTSLFILPGYKFKIVNSLITNYHLPKSTLVLLVAAFAGKEFWKEIYDYALNNDYRFLSYGDSSLITNYEL